MNITFEVKEKHTKTLNNYEKYSVKELYKICDYYGMRKNAKLKKIDLINLILKFEINDENNHIVCKRKIMWSLMDELNYDDKMKKYIIWNSKK